MPPLNAARGGWALTVLLLAAGCASAWRVAPERARDLVQAGAVLIDVRSPEEFAAGHLEGAKNIPVGELAQRLAEVGPLDASVVVYCRSGLRSGRAAKLLAEHGYRQVADLGPIGAWPARSR